MAVPLQRRISNDSEHLREAVKLLKRGKRVMNRVGWEKGETDAEWSSAVTNFLTMLEEDHEMARMISAGESA